MLALLIKLLPFAVNLAPVLTALIAQIKSESGMTTDQILAGNAARFDENEKKILEHLAELK